MDFIKNNLNQIGIEDDNLYDIIYDLFFIAKLKDSINDVENGRACTLEEFKEYIDGRFLKFISYMYLVENKIKNTWQMV